MSFVRKCLILILFFSLIAPAAYASSRIEFILDVSGSMGALAGGEKKIDAAKKAVAATVQSIPDNSVVALRLYGHRIPNNQKEASCKDSELVIPFGPINKTQFMQALNAVMPLGQTPIAFSLTEAAKDFGPAQDEEAVIILVSDGAETCGGDPVQVAKDLLAKGFKVKINTIGFDVDAQTRAQLESISKATGGQYMDAKDTAGLSKSLQELTQQSLLVEKSKSVYGQEIRGGDSYETAVPLPTGKEFRLDHHQKKNFFDYFYIDLKSGQKLVATFKTGEKGVDIRNGQAKETQNPYAGMEIHNSSRQKIVGNVIIGDRNASRTLIVPVGEGQDGRFYILVGNTYDNQHKDHPFQIDVKQEFDAGTQQDAGDKEATALTIQPMETKGYLGPNDRTDMYKFTAAPGAHYDFKARPDNEQLSLRVEFYDVDGARLLTADAPNAGAAVKVENFSLPKGGDVFIKLFSYYSNAPDSEYQMSLAQAGGPTAASPQPTPPPKAQPTPPPSQGNVKPTTTPTTTTGGTGTITQSKDICKALKGLPFLEKAKFYLFWVGIPLLAGWLIGMIWGYIKGRKSGKRKALASQQKPPSE